MNILMLSSKDVTGLNHGAAIRIYNIAKRVADHGNKVTLIVCVHHLRKTGFQIESRSENLTIVRTSLIEMILSSFFFSRMNDCDLFQIEFPYLSYLLLLARLMGRRSILDEHGVEIEFVKEISKARNRKLSTLQFLRTLLLEFLGTKLSTRVLVCSRVDAKKLRRIYRLPDSKIVLAPNGVDEKFAEPVKGHIYKKPAILFVGSFDHAPNVYATKFLLNEVIPEVFSKNLNCMFVFVGRNPPSWLLEKAAEGEIEVFGNVDDVRPFIAGASLVVTPIFHGSGTRIKILECASMGKAIVSTSKGAEGLALQDGHSILLRENARGFAQAILLLLENRNLAITIGTKAREKVAREYSWALTICKIEKTYEAITHHRSRPHA